MLSAEDVRREVSRVTMPIIDSRWSEFVGATRRPYSRDAGLGGGSGA